MEHSFRIAIWMFLLLGFLQAKPVALINDFGFTLLRNEVSCSENVTFASPSTMTGYCPGNSLRVMKDGLEQALRECKDTNNRVRDAIDAWGEINKEDYQETSSNCTSQKAGNWTEFITGCETFFQRLRSKV